MRKKKKQKLKEETFWANFCHFNLPKEQNEIPTHIKRVNFRLSGADDEDLQLMAGYIKSIEQLDLDETEITNLGLHYLTQLESIKELRLKGCQGIDDDGLPYIYQIKGLELLHLGSTSITVARLQEINKLPYLKTLLISANDDEEILLPQIARQLPKDCVFIVNHKDYILPQKESETFL